MPATPITVDSNLPSAPPNKSFFSDITILSYFIDINNCGLLYSVIVLDQGSESSVNRPEAVEEIAEYI